MKWILKRYAFLKPLNKTLEDVRIMNLNEINLFQGIDNIHFGMTKEQVINILGKEYEETVGEYQDILLSYRKLGIDFTFWCDENFRLGVIGTERKKSLLRGEKLIGRNKEEIITFIKNNLNSEITEEDGCEHEDGSIQEWIDVAELYLSFWFNDNILYLIEWVCPFVDEETPNWPA